MTRKEIVSFLPLNLLICGPLSVVVCLTLDRKTISSFVVCSVFPCVSLAWRVDIKTIAVNVNSLLRSLVSPEDDNDVDPVVRVMTEATVVEPLEPTFEATATARERSPKSQEVSASLGHAGVCMNSAVCLAHSVC